MVFKLLILQFYDSFYLKTLFTWDAQRGIIVNSNSNSNSWRLFTPSEVLYTQLYAQQTTGSWFNMYEI